MAVTWDGAGGTRGAGAVVRARLDAWAPPLVAVALAAACGLLAMQGAYNHDEEQYVAATVLARSMRPVLDFPYLQSPLQPWLFAPVFALAQDQVFAVARLLSAALTLAAFACGYAVVRRSGGSPALAALASAAVGASSVVRTMTLTARNDALPCALTAAGVLCLILRDAEAAGTQRRPALAAAAGLLLSLSLSAKLTYVFAPAAGGLWLLGAWARGRAGWREVLAFSLAAALGLAPILATLAAGPAAAWFDMVGFHRDATPAWYVRNGVADHRDLLFHLAFWVAVPLRDPPVILAALGLVATGAAVLTGRARGALPPTAARAAALLALFAAVAALAASLPNPSFTAYAAPPCLLAVLAFAVVVGGLAEGRLKTLAVAFVALGAVVGWAPVAGPLAAAIARPSDTTVARVHAAALEIRARMAASGLRGPVATLNPVRVLDAGIQTYPELAPGPFLFRAGDDVAAATVLQAKGATPATMDALFRSRPPAAILTGYEADGFRIVADAPLAAWARAHGYRETPLSDGGRLFVAPSPRAQLRGPIAAD